MRYGVQRRFDDKYLSDNTTILHETVSAHTFKFNLDTSEM